MAATALVAKHGERNADTLEPGKCAGAASSGTVNLLYESGGGQAAVTKRRNRKRKSRPISSAGGAQDQTADTYGAEEY